jgi:hypothetical protein
MAEAFLSVSGEAYVNPTQRLIEAALNYADSLEWEITDSGRARVDGDYDLAGELAEAVDAYREQRGTPLAEGRAKQKIIAALCGLVRR